jgi:hypothetical protein
MAIKVIGSVSGVEADVHAASKALATILYDQDGKLLDNIPTFWLYQMPRVTTAAATDYFDLFNATGSGLKLKVMGLYPVINVTAANATIPSYEWSVIQTSAVGTGGTVHTFEGVAAPATGIINISRVDDAMTTLNANITARAVPTGGATAQKFLFDIWLTPTTTLSAVQEQQYLNWLPAGVRGMKELVIPENRGIKVRQITAVASTGVNFGWLLVFGTI